MFFLRQKLKGLLIEKQHKLYDIKCRRENLNYNNWIRQKEEENEIVRTISIKNKKSRTTESKKEENGRNRRENEGKHSHNVNPCRSYEAIDRSGQKRKKMFLASLPVNLLYENGDAFFEGCKAHIVIISLYGGEVSEIAYPLIYHQFSREGSTVLVYGDEDTLPEGGEERQAPWFKPDWSPDRFLCDFYFGGLVAVRMEALKEAYSRCPRKQRPGTEGKKEKDGGSLQEAARRWFYLLLFEMLKEKGAFGLRKPQGEAPVYHIRQVLFHNQADGYEKLKHCRLPGRAGEEVRQEAGVTFSPTPKRPGEPLVSVVIPSKDNPQVLFLCLDSFLEKTVSRYPFEFILVDNGSREENKEKIEKKTQELNKKARALADNHQRAGLKGCRYLYCPMPFNFSQMCNMGAQAAEGELLLFLNDDMEIIQPSWLDLLAEKAVLSYVGAVGAKLLYPDSQIIQHAGITNLRIGPAHKLQYLSDDKVHYFGRNRGVHDMLGVTGACLLVRREVFDQVGGFYQGLAVAFNDVDLCYHIYERGYYNVARNDVALYHHESLSRGKDGESEEKQLRLMREGEILCERHLGLYGKDPFYHPYLTTDIWESEYSPLFHYQVTPDMAPSRAIPYTKEAGRAKEDKCLVVGMECARDIFKWKYATVPDRVKEIIPARERGFYFQGYSFVIGADNACYKRRLLLKNRENGQVWAVAVSDRFRRDIRENLKDQTNVDLTGFAARLEEGAVPPGVYQFGMLAEDKCSRQKLVNWSNWILEVGTDGK